jgi:hydroxymethylbilane synthase
VPAQLAPGLVLSCEPKREDARDVLVAPRYGTLDDLPRGARVGTSSLRRAAALGAYRPDLVVQVLRGNVDTRLRKVDAGECDAIVLARAGLVRLGREERATQVLPIQVSLPAPGQGALGVECREADSPTRALVANLHDPEAATCVAAERGVLIAVGGDCRTPLGAYAQRAGDMLHLLAFVATADAKGVRHAERTVPWPTTEADARAIGLALGGFLCAARN